MTSTSVEPSTKDTIVAIALLVFGAIAVAFMPNTAKLAFQDGSNTETVVTIRALTAVILLGGYMSVRRVSFTIPAPVMWLTMVACVSSALMNYCFYSALNFLDISLASLIIFTHPLWVAFYYHVTGKSPLTNFRLFWGVAALIGMTFALAADVSDISFQGVALASAAAFFATTMVLAMIRVNERVGGITTSFHISFWALVLFSILLFSFGTVQLPSTTLGWVSSIGNGIAYMIAYLSFLIAAGLIGASRATMLTFMEPITTILLAAWLFGERLSPSQWGGVALVALGLLAMEAPKGTWSKVMKRYRRA